MKKYFSFVIAIAFCLLLTSCDEGGVRVKSNMEKYALEYIENKDLLEADEEIVAYYDYTVSLDGTEAAILTNKRVMYHKSSTSTTSINLEDVKDINHRTENLIGEIIEVYSEEGDMLLIEIAPLNNGETFLKLLKAKVKNARNAS